MKCVGYDYKFEKHLACSLKESKPSSSGSSKKPQRSPKPITQKVDDKHGSEGDEMEDDPDLFKSSRPKRQRVAKEKAKHIGYGWSDDRCFDDNDDQDYKPA